MNRSKIAASSSALALVLALVSAPALAVDDPVSGGGSAGGGINSDNVGGGANNTDPVMDRKNEAGSGDIETRTQGNSRYDNSQAGIETERELRKKDDSVGGSAGGSASMPQEEEAEE
ncbi:MAG TPA: hypothetical protein DIW43_07580 [Spongiibacteraceae bacterium]|nr:hypothetical protein [Spongiibacteraceae bacterium]MBN51653.1 hypothetical protein [Spongiibacteraceae bacterium]HCS27298.1 hypothetical protein [Spongiibacteraceae bacterium]